MSNFIITETHRYEVEAETMFDALQLWKRGIKTVTDKPSINIVNEVTGDEEFL